MISSRINGSRRSPRNSPRAEGPRTAMGELRGGLKVAQPRPITRSAAVLLSPSFGTASVSGECRFRWPKSRYRGRCLPMSCRRSLGCGHRPRQHDREISSDTVDDDARGAPRCTQHSARLPRGVDRRTLLEPAAKCSRGCATAFRGHTTRPIARSPRWRKSRISFNRTPVERHVRSDR